MLKMKLALLLVISLLLTMEITDWIQLQLHPESYPFGKGDLPWYYHNQISYQIHLGIMISYLSLTAFVGVLTILKEKWSKVFYVLSTLYGIYYLYLLIFLF